MATKRRNTNDERLAILAELLRQPANKECADCGAPGPRWASWSIGVFLCINCAGIHRSLGTHISKVKSATLDKWTDEQIESIRNMGNAKARQIYEANVPADYMVPRPGGPSHALESWIRAKYERKMFMGRARGAYGTHNHDGYDRDAEEKRARKERRRQERRERKAREQAALGQQQQQQNGHHHQIARPPPSSTASHGVHSQQQQQHSISLFPTATAHASASSSSTQSPLFGDAFAADQNAAASPKLDKASILSLYHAPIAPTNNGMMVSTHQQHTSTVHKMAPNYNVSLAGGYGAIPVQAPHYQNMGVSYQQAHTVPMMYTQPMMMYGGAPAAGGAAMYQGMPSAYTSYMRTN